MPMRLIAAHAERVTDFGGITIGKNDGRMLRPPAAIGYFAWGRFQHFDGDG